MKRLVVAIACLCLAASTASAQSVGEKTGINSTLGISPSTPDFVKQVAVSDIFEIASSKMAQEKGAPPDKTFAAQMVTDHTKTSNELKALISSGKVEAQIPSGLDNPHQAKLDKLKSLSGADFSSSFRSMQVDAHKDAVDLFERYAKSGDNSDLQKWAQNTLPALKHHLEMAQGLEKQSAK
ncbi:MULTISPECIES: DUF4142 domain-containing protein [unclassified Afipia]|uniref:DUF4142 domain-containing protein n=1 Tax=unclassified Afipia TaxID=2642050 RepID=UPI000463383E|nr:MULTISPECIES: DUF4142 domain-containing protein [unclassified Afipia]